MIRITVKANPDLYRLIADAADRDNVSLGEMLVRLAAAHFGRPELGAVPRKKSGRPRRELTRAG